MKILSVLLSHLRPRTPITRTVLSTIRNKIGDKMDSIFELLKSEVKGHDEDVVIECRLSLIRQAVHTFELNLSKKDVESVWNRLDTKRELRSNWLALMLEDLSSTTRDKVFDHVVQNMLSPKLCPEEWLCFKRWYCKCNMVESRDENEIATSSNLFRGFDMLWELCLSVENEELQEETKKLMIDQFESFPSNQIEQLQFFITRFSTESERKMSGLSSTIRVARSLNMLREILVLCGEHNVCPLHRSCVSGASVRIKLVCGEDDERLMSKKTYCVNETSTLSDLRRMIEEHVKTGHRKRATLYTFDPLVEIEGELLTMSALGIRTYSSVSCAVCIRHFSKLATLVFKSTETHISTTTTHTQVRVQKWEFHLRMSMMMTTWNRIVRHHKCLQRTSNLYLKCFVF